MTLATIDSLPNRLYEYATLPNDIHHFTLLQGSITVWQALQHQLAAISVRHTPQDILYVIIHIQAEAFPASYLLAGLLKWLNHYQAHPYLRLVLICDNPFQVSVLQQLLRMMIEPKTTVRLFTSTQCDSTLEWLLKP